MAERRILALVAAQRSVLVGTLALAALGCALAATIIVPPAPRLVWNVSASAPRGLYLVGGDSVRVGDMVIARVPAPWRRLAAVRRYLPANVPLVKRVAARHGDRVCASGRRVLVNGRPIAERRALDGGGRPMPWWTGCFVLGEGALFLLMDSPDSFDGRYFGPTRSDDIVGGARLLWRV